VFNSNIGMGVNSLDSSNNIVGVGTTCLDNVYQVAAVSIAQTTVPGVGLTNVSRVTVSVFNYNGLSGMGYSNFYGEFSWGKINTPVRKNPINFDYNKYYYKLSLELNPLLGQIYEIDIYDPNSAYLVQNKQYARLTGERKAYLQAQKLGATFSVIFDVENPALSDETNLITRYSQAISYLLS
jgi:hypothetical protein